MVNPPNVSLCDGFSGFQALCSKRIVLPLNASSHHLSTKLVRQLLLDFPDLPGLAIVSQCPGHLLVGHFLAVTLLDAPAVSQCLFVFGGELESAFFFIHPPDAVLHISTLKQAQKELVQSDLLLTAYAGKIRERGGKGSHIAQALNKEGKLQLFIIENCSFTSY